MKIHVISRGGESPVVGEYAAKIIRAAIESAASYGATGASVAAEVVARTDSLRPVAADYATVTEDDGTELWRGWLNGLDEPAPLDLAKAGAEELIRLVREKWDTEFTGHPETAVDVRQARTAVETVLAALGQPS